MTPDTTGSQNWHLLKMLALLHRGLDASFYLSNLDSNTCDQVGGTWMATPQDFRTNTVLPVRRGRLAASQRSSSRGGSPPLEAPSDPGTESTLPATWWYVGPPSGWAGMETSCLRGRCARDVWAGRDGRRDGLARPRSPAGACGCEGRTQEGVRRVATAARGPRSPAGAGCKHKEKH